MYIMYNVMIRTEQNTMKKKPMIKCENKYTISVVSCNNRYWNINLYYRTSNKFFLNENCSVWHYIKS